MITIMPLLLQNKDVNYMYYFKVLVSYSLFLDLVTF